MKPMLAATLNDVESQLSPETDFPLLATPKIDGIRAIKLKGKLLSRSLKPIPNIAIRSLLEKVLPDGADGEIICGRNFSECSSTVMSSSKNKCPDNLPPRFYWFDWLMDGKMPYSERMERMAKYFKTHKAVLDNDIHIKVIPLMPKIIRNMQELKKYEKEQVEGKGHEGIMLRKPDGIYKHGRSTIKERLLMKVKRFEDSEAKVVGFEELRHNHNEAKTNALGQKERSHHAANKVSGGVLGALVVVDESTGIRFKIGTGFTSKQRKDIWEKRRSFLGKLVKYKHMPHGKKDAPRHPVFLGLRHKHDVS